MEGIDVDIDVEHHNPKEATNNGKSGKKSQKKESPTKEVPQETTVKQPSAPVTEQPAQEKTNESTQRKDSNAETGEEMQTEDANLVDLTEYIIPVTKTQDMPMEVINLNYFRINHFCYIMFYNECIYYAIKGERKHPCIPCKLLNHFVIQAWTYFL